MNLRNPDFDGGLEVFAAVRIRSVVAILVTADDRYLLQLRDNRPEVPNAGHWGGFGGYVEAGETPRQAIVRELQEELEFHPRQVNWFTEAVFDLSFRGYPPVVKVYFEIPITEKDRASMVQHEGEARALFTPEALALEPLTVPYDVYGVQQHARHRRGVFAVNPPLLAPFQP